VARSVEVSADDPDALVLVPLDQLPTVVVFNHVGGVVRKGGDHRHPVAQGGELLGQFCHDDGVGSNIWGEVEGKEKNTQRVPPDKTEAGHKSSWLLGFGITRPCEPQRSRHLLLTR